MVSTLISLSSPALAQQSDTAEGIGIEEIVVTASKRGETNAQDLAMSIVALDEETLERMRVSDFTDFSQYVAGLDAVQIGPGQRRYLIRGINLPGESTVGLYYDGIPMSGNGDSAAFLGANQPDWDMFDVQRVEVLRGPQGTLYGANSVAGVVRIITNKPDPTAVNSKLSVGAATVTDGDPNYNVKAMVNFPRVDDTAAVRLVAYYDLQGGWIDNVQRRKGSSCYGVQAPVPEIIKLGAW
jgi:outer membrane receptor protein involved in Fe transport